MSTSNPKDNPELQPLQSEIHNKPLSKTTSSNKAIPPQFQPTQYAGGTYMKYEVEYMKKARTKNILLGLALTGLIGSIFFYSMAKVSQDNFTDIDEKGNRIPK